METKATEKYKKKLFTKEKPAKGNVGGFLRSVSRLRFRAYSLTGNILFYFWRKMMNQKENPTINTQPCYRKVIGNTTYVVRVHFNETAKETLEDKIKRLVREEATGH